MKCIDEVSIKNKKVLLRVDFNVSLDHNYTISDDERIRQSLPTIEFLMNQKNKLIIVSHLDRPKQPDPNLSLKRVAKRLNTYLPKAKVVLIDDFLTEKKGAFDQQDESTIFMLENIRFYPEEKKNDSHFAKKLASLGDVFVNDAFAVCHRAEASVIGVTAYLPSYAGLLLKKEIHMISKAIKTPKKPLVTIIGGAKISTKINLIGKLIETADYVLLGGGLANAFFKAQGYSIGKSMCEYEMVQQARRLLFLAAQKNTAIVLPTDVIVGNSEDKEKGGQVQKLNDIPKDMSILDIGPETKAIFGAIIAKARTIIWNGPVGLFENPHYRQGTDFIYYSIAHNNQAVSIVGGGDTLAAISKKEYLDKITHISTGGGAMLEFIENGTLPGIEALNNNSHV